MIPKLREENLTTKQKGNTIDGRSSKVSTIPSTSWSMLRDSRVVRVSRAVGGKDRHSKVCTVRGLRDRRIRLSVPTAIQLYDLQDRLGLNQPSKVVDWLLDVAKHEIDELPPLQFPLGCFGLDHNQQVLTCHDDQAGISSQSEKSDRLKINSNFMSCEDSLVIPKPSYWNFDPTLRDKYKEISTNTGEDEGEKNGANVSSINFFPIANHSSLLNNPNLYSSFYRLDNPSFPLPQMRREDLDNLNVVALPPTQPYFPSHVATSLECDPQQINHFHRLSTSSTSENPISNAISTPTFYSVGQLTRPLHLSMGPKLFGSEDNNGI